MKKRPFLKIIIGILAVSIVLSGCKKKSKDESFSFVFMTDIHLTPERNAVPGLMQAITVVNDLHPDFIITGGDLIMDALGQKYSTADSLYNRSFEEGFVMISVKNSDFNWRYIDYG